MRVLYAEFVAGFGGSLTAILDTVDAMGREIEPTLVLPYDPRPYRPVPANLELRVVPQPKPMPGTGRLRGWNRLIRSNVAWARLLDPIVREVKPALIHANNSSGMNMAAAMVGWRHGIPVVSHQRDAEYPGWSNWLAIRAGLYSHHITVSDAMVPSLTGLGLARSRCSVIYDPIAAPPPPTGCRGGGPGRPLTVAMYSMLGHYKGQHIFLRAISKVVKNASVPLRVVVGGSEPLGGCGYLDQLKQLAADLGLESRVEFTGFSRDIFSRLYETDILVLATIDIEPGGHIVQEAMACGAAVITTDGGGPSEYARNSEGGLIIPRGDVDAMADAIERLLADQDLRAQIAERGRDYARRAFDPATIGSQILTVYQACLNGG